MAEWPEYYMPPPPILTTLCMDSMGGALVSASASSASAAWSVANAGYFYPFRLTARATVYQLLFFVGDTSSGNIDMAIYDSQKNRIVSAGSTAMSATVNTIQELNITDTVLAAGDYWLAVAVDNTTGTCFQSAIQTDEISFSRFTVYTQTGLTAAALPDPMVPVLSTETSPPVWYVGLQLVPTF